MGRPETDDRIRELPPGSLVLSGDVPQSFRWNDQISKVSCIIHGFDRCQPAPNHIVIDLDRTMAEFFGFGRRLGPIRF